MINIKLIKNEKDYKAALNRIEELFDIPEGDHREDELELLYVLVEKYEDEKYKIDLPDPIEAIKFRMEQSGMTRKDLAKYIGSLSKVSEVLNRKRPLSLTMIRALNEGMGIPADILLKDTNSKLSSKKYDLANFPFAEMFKRNYFKATYKNIHETKEYGEECLSELFSKFKSRNFEVCYRKSETSLGDKNALMAWQAKALNIVSSEEMPPFDLDAFKTSIGRIIKLSYFPSGIQLIKEALNKIGVHFVTLSHLPKTRLDGACFFSSKGNPVVAMTIRYDRLDNFWFTLLHELGHIIYGDLKGNKKCIMDDTESSQSSDRIEIRADKFARDSFIPQRTWNSRKDLLIKKADITDFAEELGISPAIVAGRIRKERKDYTKFSDLVGQGNVRELLKEFE